jgi:hypothetical protein
VLRSAAAGQEATAGAAGVVMKEERRGEGEGD